MFGRRPDATLVRDLGTMRRFQPYVSPRRNDAIFYLTQDIEVEAAIEFLEKRNIERPPDRPMSLFHLFLRSLSQAHELRPRVNRFVKGGKLWQREGVWLSFSALREMKDGAPMITIKRRFQPESETLDEMVDGIYGGVRPARAGRKSTSDKEMGFLLRLPGFLIRGAMGLLRAADHVGLMPRAMIEGDPLFVSTFVGNLGSVGHEAGFHHGKINPGPKGRRTMRVCWTYDERIEDGLYSQITIAGIQERIENPELLELSTEVLRGRSG
jgi:hypothetical protein